MEPTKGFFDECPSLNSSRSRLDSKLSNQQSDNFSSFKQEVEYNYSRSVANHIYSFPLQLEYCASLVSSDDSSLQKIQEYDLNEQNTKYSSLQNQLQNIRLQQQKTKLQILHKNQRKKIHIRNQSALVNKKYKDIIKLLNQSLSPKKHKSTKKTKGRQQIITFLDEKQKQKQQKAKRLQTFQFKKDELRRKSNRLKTQPNESFKTTFRKPINQLRFENNQQTKNQQ